MSRRSPPSGPEAVLEERARRLGRPGRAPRQPGDALDLVRFRTSSGEYALEARWVFEVFRVSYLARLPSPLPPARALTSWRGEIVPVLDLGQVLSRDGESVPEEPVAVLLGTDRPRFAFLASGVPSAVSELSAELRALPPGIAADETLVAAVLRDGALVLNGEEILRRHG